MSLCVRSCIGKKLNHLPAACADVPLGEPLLFLYPAWFRAITQPQHANDTQRARYCTSSSLWAENTRAVRATPHENNEPRSSSTAGEQQLHGIDKSTRKRDVSRRLEYGGDESGPVFQNVAWRDTHRQPFHHQRPRQGSDQKRADSSVTRKQSQKRIKHKTNRYQPKPVDVLAIAQGLNTLELADLEDQSTIAVSASFLEWLTGTTEENSWKHHDGSGCIVRVKASAKQDAEVRDVTLIGTLRAREIASQHFDQLQRDYHERHQDRPEIDYGLGQKSPSLSRIRVDHIARPATWTLRSFSQYVDAVVNAQAPHAIERILYPGEENYNKIVAKILMEIFHDPCLWSSQSSFALRQALKFCSTRTDIAFAARNIWISARRAGVIPDAACFNFEIARCLRVGNAPGVVRLTHEMRTAHVRPDGTTGALLYGALRKQKDRAQLLQLSAIQSTIHDRFSKELVVHAFVDQEFRTRCKDPQGVAKFQKQMTDSFGDDWLTPPVVGKMIAICVDVGSPRTVSKVLKLATECAVELDTESFTMLLKAVGETNWFEDVLSLLRIQLSRPDGRFSQRQIEDVFRQVWKQRLINTCRVIWQYAASHGRVTHGMLKKVSVAVTQNKHPDTGCKNNATTWMAALVIGTDHSILLGGISKEALADGPDEFRSAVTSLSRWVPHGQERHRQMQVAHALLEREMTVWQRVSPMPSQVFLALLDQAFELDTKWQEQDLLSNAGLSELLEKVIPIRLEPLQPQDSLNETGASILPAVPEGTVSILYGQEPESPCEPVHQPADNVSWMHNRGFRAYATRECPTLNCDGLHNCLFTGHVPIAASAAFAPTATIPFLDLLLHYLGLAWPNR